MDDLASKFEEAQRRVKQLSKTPSNEELLELYAFYKQATAGDVSGSRPGMMDFKGRARFTWLARGIRRRHSLGLRGIPGFAGGDSPKETRDAQAR